ncbi:MAG: hypothetical protein GXP63_01225 [DPANN group archaeon]|nr:hypothetical protein [DPANN group archaeon]
MEPILIDNQFSIDLESGKILPKDNGGKLSFVSHGHFDHIPTRLKDKTLVCSPETRKVLSCRIKNRKIAFGKDSRLLLLDAGHTIGSRMLYLREHDLLYTGDFNTIQKYCGQARPRSCSTLIVEATYGRKRYAMPGYHRTIQEMIGFVRQQKKVIFDVYAFGKAQEVCHILDQHQILFQIQHDAVQAINDALGLAYSCQRDDADVIISDQSFPGFKTITLSGWVLDRPSRHAHSRGFPISDHADHPSLMRFVGRCDPDRIFTFHGFAEELAASLNREGFRASPLLAEQKLLGEY